MAFKNGPERESRRDGHAVAAVAQTGAGHRCVHGDEQAVVARRGSAFDERHRAVAVLPDVELEPQAPTRARRSHVFDRGRAEGRECEGDARGGGRGSARPLALRLHHAREAGRRDAKGQRRTPAQHVDTHVHVRDVSQDGGMELDVIERLPGSSQTHLALGGPVRVVEGALRRTRLRDRAQVPDGQRAIEAPLAGIELRLLELKQRRQVFELGDAAFDHAASLHQGPVTDPPRRS